MPHYLATLSAGKLEELRPLYEDHSITLSHICTYHDLSYYHLQKLAKIHKWKQRPVTAKSSARQSTQVKSNRAMLKRMQLIAKRHVENLERSLEADECLTSSTNRDKDARTLRTLIKIIEEINMLAKDLKADMQRSDANIEPDTFGTRQRRELTMRLKALRCKT